MWSLVYGATLILVGAGLVAWAVVRIHLGPGTEGWLAFMVSLATQIFVALGSFVLGIERIRERGFRKLRPLVRPDEWLVENYGPKSKEPK